MTVTPGNRIHKYADDTYILVPASNTQSRIAELDHVEQWAQINKLKLNRAKSMEIIITGKRKHQDCNPSHRAGIRWLLCLVAVVVSSSPLMPFTRGEGGGGSPSNTRWPGSRPTCLPSFILIHLTVWPQYTNVSDRQTDRQRSHSIGRTVLKTVAQK